MQYLLGTIAMDVVPERQREGERRARLLAHRPRGYARLRGAAARVASRVSAASGSLARRLEDECAVPHASESRPTV